MILGVPVALAVGGLQMASPESAMVWAHSALFAGRRWSWSEWRGCLWVGGIYGLLVEGSL